MKLDLREKEEIAILELSGNLTSSGGDEMFREAIDTLAGSGRLEILLDCTRLEFMDSAGIGELVAGFRMVEKFGGKLKILKATSRVRKSLTLAKLLPIFEIYEDEQEAISSFSTPSK
jgi:anti-sigma B factor antagonist